MEKKEKSKWIIETNNTNKETKTQNLNRETKTKKKKQGKRNKEQAREGKKENQEKSRKKERKEGRKKERKKERKKAPYLSSFQFPNFKRRTFCFSFWTFFLRSGPTAKLFFNFNKTFIKY